MVEINPDTFTPADGQRYYYYNLQRRRVMFTTMKSTDADIHRIMLGNVHETERAAQDWGDGAEYSLQLLIEAKESRSSWERLEVGFDLAAFVAVSEHTLKKYGRAVRARLSTGRKNRA